MNGATPCGSVTAIAVAAPMQAQVIFSTQILQRGDT
jgi:hypothetical protein